MSTNQRIILYTLLIAFFLTGCSHNRHAVSAWKSLLNDFPEHIYMCPTVNAFKYSKVGVFRFSEPSYAMGTGKAAADAVFDDLLEKGVFFQVINEAILEDMDTTTRLEIARSRGYDLIITGDVLHYFDGSDFKPSGVQERIRVTHVPSNRILWSATAESISRPALSTDFLLFQTKGEPARPATGLVKENALKFSNMLLKQPKQESSAKCDVTIPLSSHTQAIEGIEMKVNALASQNSILEQQLRKEIETGECLKQEVDNLSAQTDQLERQLKEEIERGEVTLKRDQGKTTINIDNRICFDSGSAVLKTGVKETLIKISKTLNRFSDSHIQVEGHTDDIPIRNGLFPSNWELSSARALAVLRFLLDKSGIEPGRLSAAGYGKYHPIAPNDSSANRQLNRRVDIVIESRGT